MPVSLRFRSAFLFLLLAAAGVTVARAEHLPVKIYTSADGLGSSFVDHLSRDSRGFMWFCTRDGLSRFDGSQFTTYRLTGENAAPGFESITETSKGIYFVSTTGGLFYFDSKTLSQSDPKTGGRPILGAKYAGNYRGYVYEDREGNIWLGTSGLVKIDVDDDGKPHFNNIDLHLPDRFSNGIGISDILEADDKSLWMTSNFGLIRRLPDGRVVFYGNEGSVTQTSISVLIDRVGRVWTTKVRQLQVMIPESIEDASRELFTLKASTPTRILRLASDADIQLPEKAGDVFQYADGDGPLLHFSTSKLFQSSDGAIWLTTEKGLYRFHGTKVSLASTEQGFPPSLVRMAEDAAGNMWFSGQSGIARLDRKGLISYGPADGLNSSTLFSISESPTGDLFIGNGNFFISRFDGKRFRTVKPAIPPEARVAWTSRFSFLDSQNSLWLLTQLGLLRYASVSRIESLDGAKPDAIFGTENGLATDGTFQIYEDSGGTIWVSTLGSAPRTRGLASMKRGESTFHQYTEAEGYPAERSVSSFAEASDGSMWFGFYEGGIARYRNGVFTLTLPSDGMPNGLISDLLFDSRGRLWYASTLDGLYFSENPTADKTTFKKLVTADGPQSTNIRTLVEDSAGNIYAGTVRGVDRVSADLQRVKHYSVNDGLASDFVVDSHRDRSGTLWFATTNGLSKLVPVGDDIEQNPPPIWIDGLRIAGVERQVSALGESVIRTEDLGHTQNNFEIDFLGLDFRAGESLRYQYLLEGADSEWSQPSIQRSVTYANLQPGTYRFLVRSVNSDGVTSTDPASLSFVILPPIWARWWFVTLSALIIGLMIVGLFRYRMERLREVNAALLIARNAEADLRIAREERLAELEKVRLRIATDLHDDIGASLTQIAVLSEVAQARSNGGAASPLSKISAVSNELVGTMSDIVWSINPTKDHLSDLTQRMRRFAADILSAGHITFRFTAPEAESDVVINSSIRREVFLIYKESINNVVKHSDATHVEITLNVKHYAFDLTVSDDGKGFDQTHEEDRDHGHGLLSMTKRARDIDGHLMIESSLGKGTRVSLALSLEPVTRA
jgi:signal transduction histidine kinase/ligand-binding sensor domain-containing protein